MPNTEQILNSIEHRLDELRAELDALTAARAELDGSGSESQKHGSARASTRSSRSESRRPAAPETPASPTQPESAKPARAQARRARPRGITRKAQRSAEVVPTGKLERLLSDSGGLTTSALAELADSKRDQLLTLLRELETAGRVRRSGQRRGTRWHLITDEERIEQRAAELAASRKRSA